jgi:uncharacterized protein YegP (UPF0339 family)
MTNRSRKTRHGYSLPRDLSDIVVFDVSGRRPEPSAEEACVPAKFVLRKGRTGKFTFTLEGPNGQILATSADHPNLRAAKAAIASVQKNLTGAEVDDRSAGATPVKKTTARKTTAKKTTARKTAAKKTAAKKTTARKATAKKTTVKTAAKKTTARKTAAKRAPAAKKTTTRKTAAKRTTRTTATKKATTRKTAAKKTTARKAAPRKRASKKTAAAAS